MAFDVSTVVSSLSEEAIGQAGEPVGLNKDQSVRVSRALAAHIGLGGDEAIKRAAADTGLDEECVTAMLGKLMEIGKDKVLEESGFNGAVGNAKDQAMAAFGNAGGQAAKAAGGFLGGLFGKK
jgi:hypothetical protein